MSLFSLFSAFIPKAFAADLSSFGAGAAGVSDMWGQIRSIFLFDSAGENLPTVIAGRVVTIVSAAIGVAAVISIVYAGMLVASAGGDEGKFGEAKRIIGYAVAGLLIALLGPMIYNYLLNCVIMPIFTTGGGGCS